MFTRGVYLLANNVFIKTYSPSSITINKDFEKLLTLNYRPDDVHYVLGYLALKNMIAYNQEFTNASTVNKAKTHFEASNHKMAKHWLAIMHYFGYGVPKDRVKWLQMLADNDIFNSRTLKQTLQNQNNDWIAISAEERLASFEHYTRHKRADEILPLLANHFSGHLIEFDWTGTGIKRYVPMSLRIVVKEIHERYKKALFNFDINGHTFSKDNQIIQEQLGKTIVPFGSTSNLKYKVKNLLKDHPDIGTLTYDITGLELREGLVNNKPALIAKGSGKIVEFNETISHPFRMVLYKETQNQSTARSVATPKILDKNFATISPNPIGNEFNITYTLDQAAEVEVAVYDFFGQQKIRVPSQKHIAKGTQTITVDSAALPSGTYVIQMTINGAPYSKTVVKL
ncbi:hypothetical protein ATE84_0714 [Aquimarina sp. MAR_2010_214]|uniref:T9SS type A sorting domain-containing protein n=1 Tax=Aquimarina sp. MAR_2010_214 TaxID=1250026 RepID=UPI000C70DA91|nr:T9SS type A sorting domain-containing protein [Aquimarina sp. MAR_2010_214]PKV48708.1 hypothetical protein ATE84_0714 [Aquimarina sp. MAR_2010_214]